MADAESEEPPALPEAAIAQDEPAATPAPAAATAAAAPAAEAAGKSEKERMADAALARLQVLVPGISDTDILQELSNLADVEALEALVRRGKPPKWQQRKLSGGYGNNNNNDVTKTEASFQSALSKAKNFGTVGTGSLAVGGAGQGGGLGLNRPGFGPKVQHFGGPVGGSASVGVELSVTEDIKKAWQDVQEDGPAADWVLCTYSANSKNLELKATGKGLSGLKAELGEELAWAGLRCFGVDKRGGLECRRPKYINLQYKPEMASSIKKARMGSHKSAVKAALTGTHLDVVVESMADLEEKNLIQKLQAATGAHKPNGYEFDEGVFMEADFYGLGIGASCKGETARN
eukprot:TRINITY_DN10504_c0_g1_i1.p1 TRINITY_DN10504_c0_g1~~TRINITY_DN10504_c0_g1_i1.p1  ORF type:complete len:347 (-),score=109.09 TRINITY_DN10504_c0_g1_i1:98-1138(-)